MFLTFIGFLAAALGATTVICTWLAEYKHVLAWTLVGLLAVCSGGCLMYWSENRIEAIEESILWHEADIKKTELKIKHLKEKLERKRKEE